MGAYEAQFQVRKVARKARAMVGGEVGPGSEARDVAGLVADLAHAIDDLAAAVMRLEQSRRS